MLIDQEQKEELKRLSDAYSSFKARMKKLGIAVSQEWVADKCGWAGQSTVSQYMTGRIPLNVNALMTLCAALEADPAEISPRLFEPYLKAALGPAPEKAVFLKQYQEVTRTWERLDCAIRTLKKTQACELHLALEALEYAAHKHSEALKLFE